MVEDTGKALYPGAYKQVNTPQPVAVDENNKGEPVSVGSPCKREVAAIEDRWRIDDEWWRIQPISRLYLKTRLASGQKLLLYKDLIAGSWYRQS